MTLEVLLKPSTCTLEMQQALTLLIQQGLDHLKKLRALNLEGLADARSVILGSRATVASAAADFLLSQDHDHQRPTSGGGGGGGGGGGCGREEDGGPGRSEEERRTWTAWLEKSEGKGREDGGGRVGVQQGWGVGPSVVGGITESAEAVWNKLDEKTRQFVAVSGGDSQSRGRSRRFLKSPEFRFRLLGNVLRGARYCGAVSD